MDYKKTLKRGLSVSPANNNETDPNADPSQQVDEGDGKVQPNHDNCSPRSGTPETWDGIQQSQAMPAEDISLEEGEVPETEKPSIILDPATNKRVQRLYNFVQTHHMGLNDLILCSQRLVSEMIIEQKFLNERLLFLTK